MTNTKQSKEKQDLYRILVEEVKEKVQKLTDLGMSEEEIASLL